MSASARYADPAFALPVSNTVIDSLLAHRSVRQYLPDEVSEDELAAIVAAAQSAPTSSNLQSWSVLAVRDPERKARLAHLSNDQVFIDQAPLFLVWLADIGRNRRLADRHRQQSTAAETLEITTIALLDAALAAQNAVVAAESLGLGTVYIGSLRNHPVDVAAELALPPHVFPVFGLVVGRPDTEEQADVKPRLPQETVLHREQYDLDGDAHIERYDERLRGYNRRFGRDGGWSERVLQRLSPAYSLQGRQRLREALAALGWSTH